MFTKFLAAVGALVLTAGLSVVAVAAPAAATNPTVTGTYACNPITAGYDITWSVGGDPLNPAETATIVSQSVETAPSLIGTTVQNTGQVAGVQAGVTTTGTQSFSVDVQWTNHAAGDLVNQTGVVEIPQGESCDQPDATAVVDVIAPTCEAPATLVYGATSFATFEGGTPNGTTGATSGDEISAYAVSVVADDGHTFADGTTSTVIEGELPPQLSGSSCLPEPACIPKSSVSYTYDKSINSGAITVADVDGSSHTLCEPFWVTATSWKYVKKAVWPQMLDVVQKLPQISVPGTYEYAATVTCGQGDIYASTVAQPEPTGILTAPRTPFAEHFLDDMGFAGVKPTYMKQDYNCNSVKPAVDYSLGACTQNSTGPDPLSTSNLFLVFDNTASTVPVTFSAAQALDVNGADPSAPIVVTVPGGEKMSVETSPMWNKGGSYDVTMGGVYSVTIPAGKVTIPPSAGCLDARPGDPSSTDASCVSGDIVGGSITVGLEAGLVYSIDGPGTANDSSPVTTKTTTQLPVGSYVVSVAALPGFVLVDANSWPYTINIASQKNCATVPPTVSSPPSHPPTFNPPTLSLGAPTATTKQLKTLSLPTLSLPTLSLPTLAYTGAASAGTLTLAGGLMLLGLAAVFISRRRFNK